MNAGRYVLLIAVLLAAAFCTGCARKFTRVRYELVTAGMSQREVAEALGEPETRTTDAWTYVSREGEYYRAIIRFENSRVCDKAWYFSKESADGTVEADKTRP